MASGEAAPLAGDAAAAVRAADEALARPAGFAPALALRGLATSRPRALAGGRLEDAITPSDAGRPSRSSWPTCALADAPLRRL